MHIFILLQFRALQNNHESNIEKVFSISLKTYPMKKTQLPLSECKGGQCGINEGHTFWNALIKPVKHTTPYHILYLYANRGKSKDVLLGHVWLFLLTKLQKYKYNCYNKRTTEQLDTVLILVVNEYHPILNSLFTYFKLPSQTTPPPPTGLAGKLKISE